ncbi:VOC family protein [Hymenobacter ruricola]|uniref:Glyoxalase/bleomycin resistance/extradiol dioxygenase family protein n=1 Tax=Hymenobacter ruricola TaxID=2791023 RepID=A0ABS0I719_9BACT|nr:glyoxalase/bleomycin resistance/extradiol dioxygenase family protein [Hymenobacter ruricola]MBF9222766.1 glyoxalase/bleomycin resistance/extradiol dioxygenase family protein [Hymenobacter ruricola]
MVHLSPYLFFNGNCREALAFYQSCLGGELNLVRYGDSPAAAHLPADAQENIMHGTLTTKDFILMASDTGRMGGSLTVGNNLRMSLHFDNDPEIEATFARLSDGGEVIDALADMPWGGKFGTLADRFGIAWMFNFQRVPNE